MAGPAEFLHWRKLHIASELSVSGPSRLLAGILQVPPIPFLYCNTDNFSSEKGSIDPSVTCLIVSIDSFQLFLRARQKNP